jgi:ElaB/YqjD/DUF883 family membrane-anchored ribosome-binding protein
MRNARRLAELVDDVEELLAELRDERSPELEELRSRLEHGIKAIRAEIADSHAERPHRLRRYARSLDSYINHYPRLAFATSAMVAGFVAYVSGLAAAHRR